MIFCFFGSKIGLALMVSGMIIGPGHPGFTGFSGKTIESESWKFISAEMIEST